MSLQPHGDGVVPADNKNPEPQIQPVPADHENQTPEFLNKLINELDEVRTERGRLMAQRVKGYKTMDSGTYKSNIRQEWERRNQEREADEKEDALMAQIRNIMHLLPPETRPRTLGIPLGF